MFRQFSFWVFLIGIPFLFLQCGSQTKRIPELKKNLSGYTFITKYGDCEVLSDAIDSLTGLRKTDLEPVKIFSYTHPRLKPYFTDAPFLNCYAWLSRVDKREYLLNIEFSIASHSIRTEYNGLDEESLLRVGLINGENLFLSNIINDQGSHDKNGRLSYTGIYHLSSRDIKKLRKYEISTLGVIWQGGFETYEVFEIDFVMKQLACFKIL